MAQPLPAAIPTVQLFPVVTCQGVIWPRLRFPIVLETDRTNELNTSVP